MALINISDPGAKYTDEEIKALEEKINNIYSEAQSDIQKKLDDHIAKFQKKDAIYRKKLQNKEITQAEYDAWKKGQVFTGKQWTAKKQEITAVLNNSNKVAAAMINSSAIDVFAENANFLSYSLEHTAGVNFGFGLYNTDAVTKLIKDDPQVLPKWKINRKKDYTWNQQNLNRSLTQGIIQGESLDKISKRVSTNLAGSNKNLMKTFAKTGMTQAQNSGRMTQLERAKALGLNVKKQWVATLDARTRTAHQELDGQTVDLDKPFKAEGYTIRYPGDPEAHPSLVYNCRCTLVGDLIDYPSTYDRYDNVAGKPIKNMTYKEWKKAKTKNSGSTKGTSTLKGLIKPTRPNKNDFTDPTKFEEARALYREQRKVYNEKVSQWVNSSVPKETSFEDFKTWTEMQNIKIYGDISKVDKRALTAYKERMDQLFKDFPEVKNYRTLFDIPKENQYYEFAFQNTLDFVAEANHGFTFGSSGADIISLLTTQADDVASGFRTLGDGTINQLFDHEFGHNVYDWLKHIEDRSEEGFQRRLKLEKDLVNSVYNKKGASEYSSTNTEELFAEAFSAWYGGEQTEFAKAMGDFLKRWDVI